ncbi:beta-lactamase family protein [Lojkania enalia]|uniref:Beta-lactamase family protein n=1 Tax=Lojkania enalia TaxID=147567 RepID=A0A9P4KCM1_9PLEO|nr:beta-lactamase family protein [Didymosphaeria enalia]
MLLVVGFLWITLAHASCYGRSPAHPLPEYRRDDALLKRTFQSIDATIDTAVAASAFDRTSFSIEVTSSKESLWSRHHTARERNASRPDIPIVNGDALYRIASITKVFTTLGILYQHAAGNLSLDDPVTKYVEELEAKQKGTIPWKNITLRSLASQLSGIPRDFAQGDLINQLSEFPYTPVDLGFPPVSREGLPECDEYAPNYIPPCDEHGMKANCKDISTANNISVDLLRALKSKAPIFAPNQKSTYSNLAFEILGVVIENVTGQSYESYINDAIFRPLGMTKSTFSKPPDSAGVIPLGPQYWDVDEGCQNPTGGIYSSSVDLSKFLRYVLANYNGITHALNWANPVSPSVGIYSLYGMPWEIMHTDKILPDSGRMVRFITKGGGLPGYTSIIVFVPEYDLGITILVAGDNEPDLMGKLREIVTIRLVRAADEIALQQLRERYSGTFVSPESNVNSTLSLQVDHRGLIITAFVSNSTDVCSVFSEFLIRPDRPWYVQMIPTMLYRDEKEQKGERWRFIFAEERIGKNQDVWDDFCLENVDGVRYADLAIFEAVFWDGPGKSVDTIELTGFRAKLVRDKQSGFQAGYEEQDVMEL